MNDTSTGISRNVGANKHSERAVLSLVLEKLIERFKFQTFQVLSLHFIENFECGFKVFLLNSELSLVDSLQSHLGNDKDSVQL